MLFSSLIISCNQTDKKLENKPKETLETIFIKTKIKVDGNIVPLDSSGKFIIVKKDRHFGLINSENELILPIEYDSIYHPHLEECYFISKNKLFGVVDYNGRVVIPFEYEKIAQTWYEKHKNGVDTLIVQKNGKLGTINSNNDIIIPLEYDGITDWVENGPDAHYVLKNNHYGLVNYNGKVIVPAIYERIHWYSNGIIKVKKNGKNGIINVNNDGVIPCIYDSLILDRDVIGYNKNHKDKYVAKKNNQWLYLDLNGKLLQSNLTRQDLEKSNTYLDYTDYDYTYVDLCMIFAKIKTLHINYLTKKTDIIIKVN